MSSTYIWLIVVSLAGSYVLTGLFRRYALRIRLIDHPNERSSHSRPTPRGGGVAIVLVSTVGFSWMFFSGRLEPMVALALIGGGALVALTGYLDDRRPMSVHVRLTAHIAAAALASYCLGGFPAIPVGENIIQTGLLGYLITTLGIVWALNLFNFMDGIDGIAGAEAAFVAVVGGLLVWWVTGDSDLPFASIIVGVASVGFLAWNWPPAKIFMGDVGSGYLGFTIAVLAVACSAEAGGALFSWLVLGGCFLVDATATLLTRLGHGRRVHQAHRTHAYQKLAMRLGSHRATTMTYIGINVLWLFPMAVLCVVHDGLAPLIASASLVPLVVGAAALGAGKD